jgi:hypothetical protein
MITGTQQGAMAIRTTVICTRVLDHREINGVSARADTRFRRDFLISGTWFFVGKKF